MASSSRPSAMAAATRSISQWAFIAVCGLMATSATTSFTVGSLET